MKIRQLKHHEFDQAIKLSDAIFRDEEHVSMGQSFPNVFSQALEQSFGAFIDGKLVSFIGLVPSNIKVGPANLNVFSIGSVCTHKDYRQQGISSAVLKEVYNYIDRAGASLLFVSGDRGLYTRNHCYSFGTGYQYMIDQIPENITYEGSIRKSDANDIFKIHKINREKNVRYINTVWEWSQIFKSAGYASIFKMKQELYVAENNGDIEGYVVIAVPTSISTKENAIILEWGGRPTVVKKIIQKLLTKNIAPQIELTVMWHEDLQEEFKNYPYQKANNSGTIYIVDIQRFMKQILPYLAEVDSNIKTNLTVNIDNDITTFSYKNSELNVSKNELVNVLFNKQEHPTGSDIEKIFPIPLPYTAGLNYV